jgi:hypothetical protein
MWAKVYGHVATMPDKTLLDDNGRPVKNGYPLLVSRAENGFVLPTVPLNYHVQGTAGQWIDKAKIRTSGYLATIRRAGTDAHLIVEIYDELVFDFPRGRGTEPWRTNLPAIREIMRLMELGGDDIGVPTPVNCEYHAETWAVGVKV